MTRAPLTTTHLPLTAPCRGSQVEEETRVDETEALEPLYDVIVVDNPVNTYDEVMAVVQEALGCSESQAYQIAYEIDHSGAACVATVELPEARRIAGIIRRIGIEVRVEPAV